MAGLLRECRDWRIFVVPKFADPIDDNLLALRQVFRMLQQTDPEAAAAVDLYYLQERPLADVARLLVLTPGQARWRIRRGTEWLRAELTAESTRAKW